MQFSHTIQLFETDPQLVENFYDAIIAVNPDFSITFWNFGAKTTFGYGKDEVMGKNFEYIISPNQFDIKITAIIQELVGNLEWRGEIIHKKKDNSLIFCVVSISKVTRGNGSIEYLVISRDVSERKELENLQRLNDVLEEQLNSKQIQLTDFFDRINDGFFSIDRNWIYTNINSKAAAMLGRDPGAVIGKHIWTEFSPLRNNVFGNAYRRSMETGHYLHFEEYHDVLDKWFDVDVYPSKDGLSVFLRDISEEKTAQRKLKESEELYRNIVETAQEGIWMLDRDGRITFANGAVSKMLGYKNEEMIGQRIGAFMSREAGVPVGHFHQSSKTIDGPLDLSLLAKGGELKWVLLNSSSIYQDGEYGGLLVMVMDITERRRKEQELRDSHEQLRYLASKLQHIREEERSSLAREIHDELGQRLTALKLDLYWLIKNLPADNEKLRGRTEAILELVSDTLPKVERKAIELHPSLLYDLGLLAAIEWQNKQFLARNNGSIDFSVDGTDESLTKDTAIALYRIYQEALTNITRHANATHIRTSFVETLETVQLTISDNGVGFDKAGIDMKKSLGLRGMKERCIMIGGTCDIVTAPQYGTVVSVTIPLNKSTVLHYDQNIAS